MKIIAWIFAALISMVVLLGIAQTVASERIEVVELHTVDNQGEPVVTRLWVVDHGGHQYLRVGADGSGWFSRLQANKQIQLTRTELTTAYGYVLRPTKSDLVNDLMQQKYTWGDSFFAYMTGGREGSIPIELQPLPKT